MELEALHKELVKFITRHSTEFYELPRIQSQLLELGAMTLASEHYRLKGYQVIPQNVVGGRFRVKVSSRGFPWNYSWFRVERDGKAFELHTNLPIKSHYGADSGCYVTDVAVCRSDRVPRARPRRRDWTSLPNRELVSFLEAKKLVIYPMLLAQFVGIVHELMPTFLGGRSRGFEQRGHFFPSLVSTGHPAATSRSIARGFTERGFRISIIPNFDLHLGGMQGGQIAESPFEAASDLARSCG